MPTLDFIVIALATWRIAYMVTNEDGPGLMFVILREELRWPRGFRWLDGVFACVFCMSVWVGFACLALYELGATLLLYPFAASAAGLMFASWTGVSIGSYEAGE